MKKFRKAALSVTLYILGAALLGGGAWWGYRLYEKTSAVEGEIEKVGVSRGDIELKFQDIGNISPKTLVQVFARVSGRVSEVLVKEGEAVTKGQKLAVVQPGQSEADKFLPVDVPAPIGGTVMCCEARSYREEPELVRVEQRVSGTSDYNPTCLMQVADLAKMLVKLNVSEMEVLKLRTGLPVKVSVDALPALSLTGKVWTISPRAEVSPQSGVKTFRVEIDIEQKEAGIRPGMTARIEAVMEKKKNVLKMPIAGLFEERGKQFVYVFTPGGKARRKDVRTGMRNETDVEILGGLTEGATVYADKPLNIEEESGGAAPKAADVPEAAGK